MAHTYTNLTVHALFSTKDRRPTLNHELAPQVFAYMAQVLKGLRAQPILINGVSDHVHLLFRFPPRVAVADLMEKVKANSSRWIRRDLGRKEFSWQTGYTAFSVSESNVSRVRQYVANQAEHHRKISFREEVLAFLKKNGVEYDERYVFD